MKIAVVGTGYIGISTVLYYLKAGVEVVGIDVDKNKVKLLKKGILPQKDLLEWLEFNPKSLLKKARFYSNFGILYEEIFDAIFVAVPTEKNGEPYFKALDSVIQEITITKKNFSTITIVESTLMPGVSDKSIKPYLPNFAVAPRRDWFTDKGKTVKTLPRIVGGNNAGNTLKACRILDYICDELHPCNYREAELVKAVENSVRHLGSVYAQELAWGYPDLDIKKILKLASTKWNVPEYYPNILGTAGYACSADTEILTNNGWKTYTELYRGMQILTLNLQEDKLEYKSINDIFIEYYKGKMIRIKGQSIDQLLHPNHRVLLQSNSGNHYYFQPAFDLRGTLRIPIVRELKEKNSIRIDSNFARILGWIYAEGYLNTTRKSHFFELGQSKYCKELEKDLKKANIKYKKSLHTPKGFVNKFGIKTNTNFYKYRIWVEHTQNILEFINSKGILTRKSMRLCKKNKLEFLKGLILGDGSKNGKTIYNKNDLNQLQEFIYLAGIRNNIYKKRNAIGLILERTTTWLTKPHNVKLEEYNGDVWCINTINGTFVARRNGKVFITGNCIPLSSRYVVNASERKSYLKLAGEAIDSDTMTAQRLSYLIGKLKPKSIGILGIAYLADIKVHILSGALRLIKGFHYNPQIKVNDPLYTTKELKQITGCKTFKFLNDLDKFEILIVTAGHKAYVNCDRKKLIEKTKNCRFILDNVGIWEDVKFKCPYISVGRSGWLKKIK